MPQAKRHGLNGWSWRGVALFLVAIGAVWAVRLNVDSTIHPVADSNSVMNLLDAWMVFAISWMTPIFTAVALLAFWRGPSTLHPGWMKCIDPDMVNSFDEQRYREGRAKAEEWVNSGGRLDRDPPVLDEAFENGFADRLHELREKSRDAQRA